MYTIRKKFRFEAAHRLMTSYSQKCQKVHGHSYVAEVFLQSEQLNEDGMVIDFGKLKNKLSEVFDKFDHSVVLCKDDQFAANVGDKEQEQMIDFGLVLVDWNPTAENMAKYFYDKIWETMYADEELKGPAELVAVRIHETETGWAQYTESYLVDDVDFLANDEDLDGDEEGVCFMNDEDEKEEEK